AIIGTDTVSHQNFGRAGSSGDNQIQAGEAIVVKSYAAERTNDACRSVWLEKDRVDGVVRDRRVCDGDVGCTSVGLDYDAVASAATGEVTNCAFLHVQGGSGVEDTPIAPAETDALNRETAQGDGGSCWCVNSHTSAAPRHQQARFADPSFM